jgi:hypothetical protein
MKTACLLCLVLGLISFGCDNQSQSGKTSSSTNAQSSSDSGGSVVTAPVDYLGALGNAQKKAEKTADTASLNKAIQLFQTDKGRNPRDLNELVQEKYIPRVPPAPYGMKIEYDAATGQATVVKQ